MGEKVKFERAVDVPNYNTLTDIEAKIFRAMFSRSAVPFVKGKAGEGKSAIIESIARKLDFNFIDLRLSNMDELSVGLYPTLDRDNKTNGYHTFDFAVPMWAVLANEKPTIINFEELNRCRQSVMDATLGILNERRIGSQFKFNDTVYMVATGNMGDADGTVVAEFDAALKNRLNVINHSLKLKDWREGYANEHVNEHIINFIELKPEYLYLLPDNVEDATNFATPRSWANLSKHIHSVVGKDATPQEIAQIVEEDGTGMIGASATKFINYLSELKAVTYKDVLDNFTKNEKRIEQLTRPQRTDIMQTITKLDEKQDGKFIMKMTKKQVNNFMKFIRTLTMDEQGAFIHELLERHIDKLEHDKSTIHSDKANNVVIITREFKEVLTKLSDNM